MASLEKLQKQELRKKDKDRKKATERRKKAQIRDLKDRKREENQEEIQEASSAELISNIINDFAAQVSEEEEENERSFGFWFRRNKVKVFAGAAAAVAALAAGVAIYCGCGKMEKNLEEKDPKPSKPGFEEVDPTYKPTETPTSHTNILAGKPDGEKYHTLGEQQGQKGDIEDTNGQEQGQQSAAPEQTSTGTPTGETDKVQTEVKKEHTVHTFSEWTNNGDNEVRTCTGCGVKEYRDHAFGEWADNGENEIRECVECGAKENRDHKFGSAILSFFRNKFHKETQHIVNSSETCEQCGHNVQKSWAENCTYGEVTYDSTYDYRTCEHCEHTLQQKHVFDNGTVVGNQKVYTCTNDGCEYTKEITISNPGSTYNPGSTTTNPGGTQGEVDDGRGQVTDDGNKQQGIGTGDKKDFDDEEDQNQNQNQNQEGRGEVSGDSTGQQGIGTGTKKEFSDDEGEEHVVEGDGKVQEANGAVGTTVVECDSSRVEVVSDGVVQTGIATGAVKEFFDEGREAEETYFVPEGVVEVGGVQFEYGYEVSQAKIDEIQSRIDELNGLKEALTGDLSPETAIENDDFSL